jgi:DNA-binding MarR family transcriptional regulator
MENKEVSSQDDLLNENDKKLLEFCKNSRQSVGAIARQLGIAPSNITSRLPKLESLNLIEVNRAMKRGMKTYVRTIAGNKTQEYFLEILKEIEKKGGEINENDYFKLLPFDFTNPADKDKFQAPLSLLFSKLIVKKIVITEEGKKFLESNSTDSKLTGEGAESP